jgi:hypothetical protein
MTLTKPGFVVVSAERVDETPPLSWISYVNDAHAGTADVNTGSSKYTIPDATSTF